MLLNDHIDILGTRVNMVQIPDVVETMERWITDKRYGSYIVVFNAYNAVLSKNDSKVREATNNSDLTVPDGISLVLLGRLYGYSLKKRVYGPDLTLEFMKEAEKKGYSNFFYGSTQKTLDLLVKNLKVNFPNLKIVGAYPPSFKELTEEENAEIVEMINRITPDVLWVGLGTPKQQLWIYRCSNKLKVPVMVGVGAAFDFLAGTKPQAPRWIRDNGFEWLFRLLTEPKRLWKRYLIGNTIFTFLILKELGRRLIKLVRLA